MDRPLLASSLKKGLMYRGNKNIGWTFAIQIVFLETLLRVFINQLVLIFFLVYIFLTASLITAVKGVACVLPDLTFFPSIHRTPKRTFEISREFIHV